MSLFFNRLLSPTLLQQEVINSMVIAFIILGIISPWSAIREGYIEKQRCMQFSNKNYTFCLIWNCLVWRKLDEIMTWYVSTNSHKWFELIFFLTACIYVVWYEVDYIIQTPVFIKIIHANVVRIWSINNLQLQRRRKFELNHSKLSIRPIRQVHWVH